MLSMTEQSLASVLFPCFSHGFWTVHGHCTYFYASSQLSVGRIYKTKVHLTHTSRLGTAQLCTDGLMSSFSVFLSTKTESWAATLPFLHCFEGEGAQSVEEACCAKQICFPPCSFPQTYIPFPHKNSISAKLSKKK